MNRADDGRRAVGDRGLDGRPVRLAAAALSLLALAITHAPAAAQPDPRVEVSLVALEHVRESLPRGRAVLDPRTLCQAGLVGWTCPANMPERVSSMDLELGSREFSYVCLQGSRNCRVVGTDVLVEMEAPRIFGRSASIGVNVWWRTDDAARPVGHRRSVLHLQREGQAWRVVREEMGVRRSGDGSEPETQDEARLVRTDRGDQG